ncbi:MAG: peptidylprolyl isomerase [Planctomycetia bacterium]|jgi:peptidyl-prolyl cis-trans isomerase SurA
MRLRGLVFSLFMACFLALGCVSNSKSTPLVQSIGIPETQVVRAISQDDSDSAGEQTALNVPEEKKPGQKTTGSNIVAIVNGEAVLEEEVRLSLSQGIGESSLGEQARRKAAITQLVEREIVIQDAQNKLSKNPQAKKFLDKLQELATKEFDRYIRLLKDRNKIPTDEDFQAMLESQGMSLDLLRRQSERNFMATQYMQSRIMPSLDRIGHKQIRDYYDSHKEEFQISDSVEWKDIFISFRNSGSKEEALKLAQVISERAKKGEDFAKLSKEYCHGDGAFRGGEGIGRKRGEIKPVQVENYLFSMSDGEVGPLVEIPTGIHIIKLVKREFAGLRTFDEKIQKQVRDKLRNEAAQFEMKRIVTDLKRQSVIEYLQD